MIPFQQTIIGALGGVVVGGLLAWSLAYDRGYSKGEMVMRAASKAAIEEVIKERDQAREQVDKINKATSEQVAELVANFKADSASRTEAQKAMEEYSRSIAREAQKSRTDLQTIRTSLSSLSDQCARAGVDPALIGMLNTYLASPFQQGDRAMPASAGDKGP